MVFCLREKKNYNYSLSQSERHSVHKPKKKKLIPCLVLWQHPSNLTNLCVREGHLRLFVRCDCDPRVSTFIAPWLFFGARPVRQVGRVEVISIPRKRVIIRAPRGWLAIRPIVSARVARMENLKIPADRVHTHVQQCEEANGVLTVHVSSDSGMPSQ